MGAIASLTDSDTRVVLWCQRWRDYPRLMRAARAASRSGDGWAQVLAPLLWPAAGGALMRDCLLLFAIERPVYLVLNAHCNDGARPSCCPSKG